MPKYTFLCSKCGPFEGNASMTEMNSTYRKPCPDCGEKCRRLFVPGRTQMNIGFKPYTSSDFDGEPHYVSSKAQEDYLCKKNRVRRAGEDEVIGRKKRAPVSDTPFHEDFERTRQDMRYGRIPKPEGARP